MPDNVDEKIETSEDYPSENEKSIFRRPIKTFVIRAGRMTGSERRCYEELHHVWCIPFEHKTINYTEIFNNANPVVMEIGFGMGTATAIIAILINNETIKWSGVGFWIMAVLLISSFLGGKAAIYTIKTQRFLVSFMSGGLYWAFLLCITALLFGGNYCSVWETGALITAGSITAALIHLPRTNKIGIKTRRGYR